MFGGQSFGCFLRHSCSSATVDEATQSEALRREVLPFEMEEPRSRGGIELEATLMRIYRRHDRERVPNQDQGHTDVHFSKQTTSNTSSRPSLAIMLG